MSRHKGSESTPDSRSSVENCGMFHALLDYLVDVKKHITSRATFTLEVLKEISPKRQTWRTTLSLQTLEEVSSIRQTWRPD
eukprot:3796561-Amphidinium_carterae.1